MIAERLVLILDELINATKQQNMNISNETLFSEACGFLRGQIANENRYYNPQIKGDAKSSNTPSSGELVKPYNPPELKLASDKQKSLLLTLGWKGDTAKLTKREAFVLLDEYFKNGKKSN